MYEMLLLIYKSQIRNLFCSRMNVGIPHGNIYNVLNFAGTRQCCGQRKRAS